MSLPYGILVLAAAGGAATDPGRLRAAGTVLDPTSTANALTTAQNVRLSFAAFEDDDRNGIEDHRR